MLVEISTFRLADGVTEEAFLAADARFQTEHYYQHEGIVRRTTARTDERWCVVTFSSAPIPMPDAMRELLTDLVVETYETLD